MWASPSQSWGQPPRQLKTFVRLSSPRWGPEAESALGMTRIGDHEPYNQVGDDLSPTCSTKANEVDSCVTFRQKTGPLSKGKFCSLRNHVRKIGFIA
jgi:hypothetical protein